jgi:hypothetical protein
MVHQAWCQPQARPPRLLLRTLAIRPNKVLSANHHPPVQGSSVCNLQFFDKTQFSKWIIFYFHCWCPDGKKKEPIWFIHIRTKAPPHCLFVFLHISTSIGPSSPTHPPPIRATYIKTLKSLSWFRTHPKGVDQLKKMPPKSVKYRICPCSIEAKNKCTTPHLLSLSYGFIFVHVENLIMKHDIFWVFNEVCTVI